MSEDIWAPRIDSLVSAMKRLEAANGSSTIKVIDIRNQLAEDGLEWKHTLIREIIVYAVRRNVAELAARGAYRLTEFA